MLLLDYYFLAICNINTLRWLNNATALQIVYSAIISIVYSCIYVLDACSLVEIKDNRLGSRCLC